MGQQPNIELEMSDLPRPTLETAPARRWSPGRPGDLTTPAEVPWGGAFGTTGPDAGFALRLVAAREAALPTSEQRADAEALISGVAAARASRLGRAPTTEDVEAALVLLGYDDGGQASTAAHDIAAERGRWMVGAAHHPDGIRRVIASIDPKVLTAKPEAIAARMAVGERLVSG